MRAPLLRPDPNRPSQPPALHDPTAPAPPTPARGFKALKQIIKLQSRLGHSEEMVAAYRQLLQYAPVVTRNAAEKKINSVLDFVSSQATDSQLLQVGGWTGEGAEGCGAVLGVVEVAGIARCRENSSCIVPAPTQPMPLLPTRTPPPPPLAGVLQPDAGQHGRVQERAAVVQDQHEAGQPVGRPQGGRQGGQGKPPALVVP